MVQQLWRTIWRFFKKLKIELPCDPTIPFLGIFPEKNMVRKDTCTPKFVVALFTIAKTWKQPKCPLAEAWIKTTRCIYTVEYCSDIKKNELISFTAKEIIIDEETKMVYTFRSLELRHRLKAKMKD